MISLNSNHRCCGRDVNIYVPLFHQQRLTLVGLVKYKGGGKKPLDWLQHIRHGADATHLQRH